MKTLFLLFAFCMSLIQTSIAEDNFKNINDLKSHIKKSGFNGIILVMKGKNTLMKEAFGVRDIETKSPIEVTDKFQIGSNTKQIVAAAILKLQEEGKLSLDDEVSKYLPQYPAFNDIRIKDLLNHTSGIANYTEHANFMATRTYAKSFTLDHIIDHLTKFN